MHGVTRLSLIGCVCLLACELERAPTPLGDLCAQSTASWCTAEPSVDADSAVGGAVDAGHRFGNDGTQLPATPNTPGVIALDAGATVRDMDAGDEPAQLADASMPIDASIPVPAVGALYGACGANVPCQQGLACSVGASAVTSTSSGYCASPCVVVSLGGPPCPQPTSGQLSATCTASFCRLDSCASTPCPNGMRCVKSQLPTVGTTTDIFECMY